MEIVTCAVSAVSLSIVCDWSIAPDSGVVTSTVVTSSNDVISDVITVSSAFLTALEMLVASSSAVVTALGMLVTS